jgi:hypothetical protein
MMHLGLLAMDKTFHLSIREITTREASVVAETATEARTKLLAWITGFDDYEPPEGIFLSDVSERVGLTVRNLKSDK